MTDNKLFTLWQELSNEIKDQYNTGKISKSERDNLLQINTQQYEIERNKLYIK